MSAEMRMARGWVQKGRSDLLNADNNLRAAEIPYDTGCFHCQQAAEKLLKGYLAANEVRPPRTHDLLMLLEQALVIEEGAERLRDDLALLTPYAVEIRYPDDQLTPGEADARDARKAAARVLLWLTQVLPEMVKGIDFVPEREEPSSEPPDDSAADGTVEAREG
jgi:HEPN domain-containing protein